jgi:uncharacterized membrane protein YkvA (DUF1232 family)
MWKRLSLLWSLARGDLRHVWAVLKRSDCPAWFKLGIAGVALYVISPIDFIPDFLPLIGLADDGVLVPLAIRWLLKRLPPTFRPNGYDA